MSMSILERNNECVQVAYKVLNDNKIYPEIWCDSELPFVYVQIDNGDWKHDHLLARNLLEEARFQYVNSCEVGDSEDDCYSAVHKFMCLGVDAWSNEKGNRNGVGN